MKATRAMLPLPDDLGALAFLKDDWNEYCIALQTIIEQHQSPIVRAYALHIAMEEWGQLPDWLQQLYPYNACERNIRALLAEDSSASARALLTHLGEHKYQEIPDANATMAELEGFAVSAAAAAASPSYGLREGHIARRPVPPTFTQWRSQNPYDSDNTNHAWLEQQRERDKASAAAASSYAAASSSQPPQTLSFAHPISQVVELLNTWMPLGWKEKEGKICTQRLENVTDAKEKLNHILIENIGFCADLEDGQPLVRQNGSELCLSDAALTLFLQQVIANKPQGILPTPS